MNEKAARVAAGVVAVTALAAVSASAYVLLVPLVYGFWARVLAGPRFSPLALFATKIATSRLGAPHIVPGPPKRFAQGMGAAMTTGAVLALALGAPAVTDALLVALVAAATLESAFGLCLGCKIFALLMRAGVVPERVCLECANIWARAATRDA